MNFSTATPDRPLQIDLATHLVDAQTHTYDITLIVIALVAAAPHGHTCILTGVW